MHCQLLGQTNPNNGTHIKSKGLPSEFVISDNVFGPIIIYASFRKIGSIVLPELTNQEFRNWILKGNIRKVIVRRTPTHYQI